MHNSYVCAIVETTDQYRISLRWNKTPGKITQINSKLFDFERYDDK